MIRVICFVAWLVCCCPLSGKAAETGGLARDSAAESPSAALLAPLPGFADVPLSSERFKDNEICKVSESVDIDVHYPVFGNALIDRDISLWAHRMTETFSKGIEEDILPRQASSELRADYTVSFASPRSLTVTYTVWTYTGGVHGNSDVVTFSYDAESGRPLLFEDIFIAADTALQRLAGYCEKELREKLGEDLIEDMLQPGVAPELDNYAAFSLFPAGLRVHFQPYQIAPFAAGTQYVDVPLEVVMEAGPNLDIWGRRSR